MKRALDVLLVVLAAPVWLPAVILIAATLRVTAGAPVLFTQLRPGLGGEPFRIVKFRTMSGALDAAGDLLPDAARLTAFGRFLRSTSLDELPEFFNVILGDMSLVGPRPLLMEYLPLYSCDQLRRHAVRPGVTGWAQVNGRNAIEWEEKFALDLWYIDHCSIGLDLRILAMTFARVIQRVGISAASEATMPKFRGTLPDAEQ